MGLGDHSPSEIEALFKAEVAKCGVEDYDETLLEYVASMAHELLSDEGNASDDNLGKQRNIQHTPSVQRERPSHPCSPPPAWNATHVTDPATFYPPRTLRLWLRRRLRLRLRQRTRPGW